MEKEKFIDLLKKIQEKQVESFGKAIFWIHTMKSDDDGDVGNLAIVVSIWIDDDASETIYFYQDLDAAENIRRFNRIDECLKVFA